MNFNGIKPISARKSMSAVTWTSAVQAGGGSLNGDAILEGHDGMWCLTFGEAGAGAERRVPCRCRSSPSAFRLPPAACRLPPAAFRLPPAASGVSSSFQATSSERPNTARTASTTSLLGRQSANANRRTPIGERPGRGRHAQPVEYDDLAVAASARRTKQTT